MHTSIRMGDSSFGTAAAFLFGVFAANMGWRLWLLGTMGSVAMMAIILFYAQRKLWKYMLLLFFAVVAGALYYSLYIHCQAVHSRMPVDKQAAFFGVVTEEPEMAGNFTFLTVSLSQPYAATLDIFASPSEQFHYGDELWIEGTVSAAKDTDGPPVLFRPRLHVVGQHEGIWLKEMVIDFKEWIVARIAQALPADQAALLSAIMIGTASTMSVTLKAQMETSGTSYITGMYGYKIAIIIFALSAALKDHLSRRALLSVTLAMMAIFVFASGATISAIRAAVMGSFAVVARGTGRTFNARNAITFAATGMVVMNATLLTDAAFQLSFLSFLGIYYLGPPIARCFHLTDGGIFQWKEHTMLSLSTNLAILPIAMNAFGEFSLTSFVSNIFIMIPWLAVITFGGGVVIFGAISPYLAFCIVRIVGVLLRYELFIIRFFSIYAIPIPAIFGSAFAIALYYGLLILFAYYYAPPTA